MKKPLLHCVTLLFGVSNFQYTSLGQEIPAPNQLPSGGNVVGGQADIRSNGARMDIDQSSNRASIDWSSFNIGSDAQVFFNQPSNTSVTLNRVFGDSSSQIFGNIESNGQIFLTNPEGIYFSPGSRVHVGGLVATTHHISAEDFLEGKSTFYRGDATGSVVNEGSLNADQGGYIALLAPEVVNSGVITSDMGTVALASGEKISLNFGDNLSLLDVTTTQSQIETLVENRNAIITSGGTVILSATAVNELRGGIVNNSGEINASNLVNKGGRIFLEGDDINLASSSIIEARGKTGGGEILIGGDWQGRGSMYQATTVDMAADARIDASAIEQGNGGTIVLWSDITNESSVTTVDGSIIAEGGAQGGRGGAVETSGRTLHVNDVFVSTLASDGSAGNWLLDPGDVIISDASNVIEVATNTTESIETALASSNVAITTGTGANYTLEVYDPIEYTGANERTLTLSSTGLLSLELGGDISSSSGELNLILVSEVDRAAGFTGSGNGVIVDSNVDTNGGDMWIGGGQLTGTWNGHTVGAGAAMGGESNLIGVELGGGSSITTGGGDLRIVGTTGEVGINDTGISAFEGVASVDAGSGDVDLITDTIFFDFQNATEIIQIDGTGTLTIAPFEDNFTAAVTWDSTESGGYYSSTSGSGTFDGLRISDTLGLAIGSDSSATNVDVTLSSAIDIAGSLSIYGGDITVDDDLTTSNSGAGVRLKAADDVIVSTNSNIATNAGDITLWANFDDAGGYVYLQSTTSLDSRTASDRSGSNTSTASGGGDIILGGGSAGTTAPTGSALKNVNDIAGAVQLGTDQTGAFVTIYSGGGDITMRGNSTVGDASDDESSGIHTFEGITIDAGTSGDITMEGQGSNGWFANGVIISYGPGGVADTMIRTQDGDITLSGISNGGAFIENIGLNFAVGFGRTGTIQATGTGSISISGSGDDRDLGFQENAHILAASGDIDFLANGGGPLQPYDDDFFIGYRAGTDVTASTSNINIQADNFSFDSGGGFEFNTSGTVTIEPVSASFSGTLTWQSNDYDISTDASGLTLGKAGNTSDIVLSSDITVSGPINIIGDDITINSALTATNDTITLTGAGNVTDGAGGYVVAENLALLDGAISLDNASGNVSTLAANGVDSLLYIDSNAVEIGSIGSTNGLSSTGTINIATRSGDLTLSQDISTTDNTTSAVTLNAGLDESAGTSTGGDLNISGSPTISMGSGGRATLYSGSVSGSTGLTDFIGSGSGRFRYNSDESVSNYTAALSAGNNAIYREQINLSGSISSETITYGDTIPAFTASVGTIVNGDSGVTMTVNGATYSTSARLEVGTYSVTASTLPDLGYTVGALSNGSLTVNPYALTVTGLSAIDKVYDTTTDASLSGTASISTLSGDIVNLNGTGTAAFSDKNVGDGKSVTVSGYSISGADAGNYSLAQPSGLSADITPVTVSISGITANDKVYDANTTATLDTSGATLSGILSGDTVSLNNTESATFADKNVGAEKSVTVGGYTLSGVDAGNYTLAQPSGLIADITPASVSIVGITANDKVYDANTAATLDTASATLSGVFSGDNVSFNNSGSATFSDKNVGNGKPVTVNGYTLSGTDAGNYTLVQPSGFTADITPASVSISGITANDKIYDGTLDASLNTNGVTFSGILSGDTVNYSVTGMFEDAMVGSDKTVNLTYAYSGADLGNYTFTIQETTTASIISPYTHFEDVSTQFVTRTTEITDGLIVITLPSGTSTSGHGFSFELPEGLKNQPQIGLRVADGSQLPDWLQYDHLESRLNASTVPSHGLPISLLVEHGERETTVIISERR